MAEMQKAVVFWHVATGPTGSVEWRALNDEPATDRPSNESLTNAVVEAGLADAELYGKLRVENDTHVWVILTGDKRAHEAVTRRMQDDAAIAREWMAPARFSFVITEDADQLHFALTDDLTFTLCGIEVARPAIIDGLATCGMCARLTG